MAFLEVANIHKTYAGEPLLQGVSLNVEQGEIISLLGPSGSGKTTLLRIIAGLETREAGRVILEGQDVTLFPVHRRGIVLMFQDYALFPHRTVSENVAFGLRMQGLPQSDITARTQEMLTLVGLQDFGDRDVVALSGGERQRVALARSLAPQPRLLLLDEPLGSLDRTLRERLLEDLTVVLRRVGVTTIVVTHDQAEAFALADRVMLLHETRVIQQGTPEEIYSHPATPWVAGFLGLTNLLPADVAGDSEVHTPLGTLAFQPEYALPEAGTPGTLLILPWGIHLDQEGPRHNTFTAQVTRRIFEGSTTKLEIEVSGVTLGLSLQMGARIPHEGDEVTGWVAPSALRWFADSATGGPTVSAAGDAVPSDSSTWDQPT